ncbi:hypothetical protein [Craterilacuibacter sinensis]|uniref:Uncharacterized protein n=1 Tax=Craterilacuibacter sinensis TaxID=2686017 RepID=A0A845BLY0_9NEIS|nr:hypothetical protein [Craterilacuibacter sinensis]MXR37239.1 hypothetical protein [Craterilacuibacter sinensis]
MCKVLKQVRWAIEYLQSGGVGAVHYSDLPRGKGKQEGLCGRIEATRLLEALISLPVEQHLAIMARLHADNIRLGPPAWKELAANVRHVKGPDSVRFGQAGCDWMVRKWMRPGDGSWAEFGRLFGCDGATAQSHYRKVFEPLLDGWLIAARGSLEVILETVFEPNPLAA